MKTMKRISIVALLLIALIALSACVAQAQPASTAAQESAFAQNAEQGESMPAQQQDDIGRLLDFIVTLGALVPVIAIGAPLVSTLVDAAKKAGMASKYAPALSAALNAALFTARYFVGDARETQFNSAIGALYALAPYVIALAAALLTTVSFHNKFVKAGLGYSKTPRKV